jgi:hypothetical protein
MAKKEDMVGGRSGNQPPVEPNRVAALEPNILEGEIKVSRGLFNSGIREEDLFFNKPVPTSAQKAQNKYPQKKGPDS